MDELLEEIQAIQKHLYGGYKNEGESNMDWLEVNETRNNDFKFISNLFPATFLKIHKTLPSAAQVSRV